MRRFLYPVIALVIAAGVGFALKKSAPTQPVAENAKLPAAQSSIEIAARLVSPIDIVVDWKDSKPGAAGHVLEWDVTPDGEFVPLGFFPPHVNTHKHPDLMPETNCYYRVRAFYGRASAEVEVNLPPELTDEEYKRRFAQAEDYSWAGPVIVPDAAPVEKKSLRDPATSDAAAPTDFKITLMPVTVSAFKLTWTDHASDEDGTMIEMKKEGSDEFEMVALVEPNVNSFGWALYPPLRKTVMRVRPYYFSEPSKLIYLKTGKDPAASPAPNPLAAPKTTS